LPLVNQALSKRKLIAAAQSGFKTCDPEGGSAVKRGPRGRWQSGAGKVLLTWMNNFVHKLDFAPGNTAEVTRLEQLLLGHEERH
jgi:hypothetical protein